MKNKESTQRNHALCEKRPLLSMLLSVAAAFLVCGLAATLSSSELVQYLLISAAGILCMLAQKLGHVSPERADRRMEVCHQHN